MTLSIAALVVHLFGLVFKIYVTEKLGPVARGYYAAAYNLYTPIYSIAVSGLPVAVSTLVSRYAALDRFRDVVRVHKLSVRLFFIVGLAATAVMAGLAYPFTHYVTHVPNALPATLALTPAVLLCCLISAYRGYFAGLKNMWPHGISQVVEAVFKLFFGFVFVHIILAYSESAFANGKAVFGVVCSTHEQMLGVMWPYAAAAAIFGVSLASLMALIYMLIRYKSGSGVTEEELERSPLAAKDGYLTKQIFSIAVPVVISSLITNVSLLVDVSTIQNRLYYAVSGNLGFFRTTYAAELLAGKVADSEINTFLYGVFDYTQDIENLVPNITVTLGLAALPILSEAWTVKNLRDTADGVNSVLRLCTIIALPSGLGVAAIADELLTLLYGDTAGISIAAPILEVYGCSMLFISISQPITSMLQAVGRLKVPIIATVFGILAKIGCNLLFVGVPELNILGAAFGTAACYIIITAISLSALINATGVRVDWKTVLIKPALCSIVSTAACYGAYFLFKKLLPDSLSGARFNQSTVAALFGIVFAVVFYVLALVLTRTLTSYDVKMLPKGEKIEKTLAKHGLIG